MARYTQGLGIDEPLAMYRGGASYYYDADGLGSITSLTDASGQIAASYTYDSFGKLTASTGTVTNPFRYTGREYDSTTGLYYYRARYYDSNVGRFISEDPIKFAASVNFYAYVGNSPTGCTDADGMAFKDCLKALKDLAKATYELNKDLSKVRCPVDPGHQKELRQRVRTAEKALQQAIKYCGPTAMAAASLQAARAAIEAAAPYLFEALEAAPAAL